MILGGPIGDRFGAKTVIWFSILGVLPFTLALPYADLDWTMILSVRHRPDPVLGLPGDRGVRAGAGARPGRHDRRHLLRAGFRHGRHRRRGARRRSPTRTGIDFVFQICSYLPLLGLLTVFLPDMRKLQAEAAA